MDIRDWRTKLRIGVHAADPAAILGAFSEAIPIECLQVAGDALLVALAASDPSPEARSVVARCRDALIERGWTGDHELVVELDGALAGSRMPLPATPVDLEDLADLLEGTGEGGLLDVQTGQVWPQVAIEYSRETGDGAVPEEADGVRWLVAWSEGSSEGYADMQDFIATVSDPSVAERLSIAIEGKGAFRRFRDVLERWPQEVTRWHAFSDDRRRGRARVWLADAGYRPQPGVRPVA